MTPTPSPDSGPVLDIAAYVDQMALVLELHLTPESRQQVIADFQRLQAIAQSVQEFPLPADLEAAPQFEP